MAEQFENNYSTILNGSIDDDDTTITVDAAPVNMTGQFRIKIDDEIILVGSVSGLDFVDCIREVEGTTAAAHADNAPVTHVLTAAALGRVAFDGKPFIWTPPTTPHATDDEFNDAPTMSGPINDLDAKWTKRNLGTAAWFKLDDTVAPGCAFFDIPTGQTASQVIYQTVPGGDWTYAVNAALHDGTAQYWGILCVDSSGNGVIGMMGPGNSNGVRAVSAWNDGGAGTFWSPNWWSDTTTSQVGVPVTWTLRKASGVYHMGFSYGHRLLPGNYTEVNYTPSAFTPAYIGFGRIGAGNGLARLTLDFFRKIA